ncbi:MAG: tRNA pseudouridine(38-40) synthase TruA [Acidimicrobiales bacterium]
MKPDDAPITRRVALGIAYDGSGFHGFAAQPNQRTVAGEISRALGSLFGDDAKIVCAGRTDAGVHALAQVAHVDLDFDVLCTRFGLDPIAPGAEIPDLARSLDALVGPEIVIWRVLVAPDGFDARRSATSRRYRYEVRTGSRPDPLKRWTSWHVAELLDVSAMRIGVDALLGEHDFAGFCRRPPNDEGGPIVRRVIEARLDHHQPDMVAFEIEANAFCHQMVRSIVGTLVAAGRGSRRPSEVMRLLAAGNRDGAADPAPPGGLCLVAVRYPDSLTGTWS